MDLPSDDEVARRRAQREERLRQQAESAARLRAKQVAAAQAAQKERRRSIALMQPSLRSVSPTPLSSSADSGVKTPPTGRKAAAVALMNVLQRWRTLSSTGNPRNEDTKAMERRIATATARVYPFAPNRQTAVAFKQSVKQILFSGRRALNDATWIQRHPNDLNEDIRYVIACINAFGSGVAPPPPKHAVVSVESEVSSPSVTRLTPHLRRHGSVDAGSSRSASVPPSVLAASMPSGLKLSEIPPSQSPADAIRSQEAAFPGRFVPWILEYLADQVGIKGGPRTPNVWAAWPGESVLRPWADAYELGNYEWLHGCDDPVIPAALLRRWLWHQETPIIGERSRCTATVSKGSLACCSLLQEVASAENLGVVLFITVLMRKYARQYAGDTNMTLRDLAAAFAPCLLRSSSSYHDVSWKVKPPAPLDDDVRFIEALFQHLDTDALQAEHDERMVALAHMRAMRAKRVERRGSGTYVAAVDMERLRTLAQGWRSHRDLDNASWALPECKSCGAVAKSHGSPDCMFCGKLQYEAKSIKETDHMVTIRKGFQYEMGMDVIWDGVEDTHSIESLEDCIAWYSDHLRSNPHDLFMGLGDDRVVSCLVVVEVSVRTSASIPCRVLVLTPEGFTRTVVTIPTWKKINRHLQAALVEDFSVTKLVPVSETHYTPLQAKLIDFESKMLVSGYKVGILYQGKDQREENEIYGNKGGCVAYDGFLEWLGVRVTLKDHTGFRGGLDCRGSDTTGTHSVFSQICLDAQGECVSVPHSPVVRNPVRDRVTNDVAHTIDIMWHVATMLPYSEDNEQQLHRKRHLGNDVVVVVFQHPHAEHPFDPSILTSQFNHVFIVVKPVKINHRGHATHYRVQLCTKPGVKPCRPFMPVAPETTIFKSGDPFLRWILLKVVNAERAAMYAKDFRLKLSRTRQAVLKDWAKVYMDTKKR